MLGDGKVRSTLRAAPSPRTLRRSTAAAARCRVAAARCGIWPMLRRRHGVRARARCPATAMSARGARRTGPTATELRSATQRGLLIGADSMGCFVVDAAGFRAGRNFVDGSQAIAAVCRNLATDRTRGREFEAGNLSSQCEFNSRQAHLEIGATTMSTETVIAVAAALVLGAGTAAVAMINYEANAPLPRSPRKAI